LSCRYHLTVNSLSKARTLVLLLVACGSLCAQEYSFRYFGGGEGLSNLSVRNVYQDRVGFLWVATVNGLFRYDGESFEAFGAAQGVPSSAGTAFGEAPDGSLLAGGGFGLLRLRGNRFEMVPGAFKGIGELQGIQSDGKGHTYLNTENGLMELTLKPGTDEFVIRRIPPPAGTPITEVNGAPEAGGVLVDGETIWYGCGVKLCRLEKGETRVYGPEEGLPEFAVVVIQKDHYGDLWLRLRGAGVFVLPAGQSRVRRPILPGPHPFLSSIPSMDADGRVLLPMRDGMLIGDERGWQTIDHATGLRGAVHVVFEDRQHSLWIAMSGQGLVQWRGYREWENYTSASGLTSDSVGAILPQPGGPIWVGEDGDLMRGERKGIRIQWTKVAGLEGTNVQAVTAGPNGTIWLGTNPNGIARMNPSTGSLAWLGQPHSSIKSVFDLRFDRQRRLWVGSDGGLYVAHAPYTRYERISALPALRVYSVAEGSDGTIWAGGIGGLFSYTGGQWRNWTEADGLRSQQILSLGVGAKGTIWIAYRFAAGMDRVHLLGNGLSVEKNVQRPGSNGIVSFIKPDAQGRMWTGSDHGVDVWDGLRWSHYGMSDGLAWDNCARNAFAAEPDGTVWIGTSGGLSRFKPSSQQSPAAPVEVVFTRLLMGGGDVSRESNPSFDVHANSLLAHYTAVNASRENAVLFRYRIKGANSAWTETTQRELQFANLAPGDYRLEIEAQDADGAWRAKRAEFAFTILTPWNKAWWFYTLCGLIPLCGTWGFFRIRMAEARRKEQSLQLLLEAQKTIENLAFYDPLTELPNRRMLMNRVGKSLAGAARNCRLMAMLFVDLDKFKGINDSLGHRCGDLLLKETARRLMASTRETDTVARLGGDEFVVFLEDLSEDPEKAAAQAETVAKKVLAGASQPYLLGDHESLTTASIGITVFGIQPESAEEALQQSDIAMYQGKAAGGNTIRFFAPELQAAINARTQLEEELRVAIHQGQFLLYYQPQVDRGRVIGAEALVRWKHPRGCILAPGNFISLCEETGLILPLGDWVLETACRQLAAWARRKETAHLSIAVNISTRQLRHPSFVEDVLAAVERTAANPQMLELELTESTMVENIDEVIAKITELRAHGLRFSLDDFGAGYSSLNYLRCLPLDRLKIDRAFVKDILADASGEAIAHAIISLGRAMGMEVMAEGVESEEQRQLLASLGCDMYQGYLLSPPVPIEEMERLLAGDARSFIADAKFC